MWRVFLAIAISVTIAFGQSPAKHKRNYDIEIGLLAGVSASAPESVTLGNWREFYRPANDGMNLGGTSHPGSIGIELRATKSLKKSAGGWRIGLPLSYEVWTLNIYGKGIKNYFGQKGVSGNYVNWWDPVMANDIVSQNYSPRVGLEFAKGRTAFTFSAQHYRLMARDYQGKDCVNCVNTSSVMASRQLGSGVSPRFELVFSQTEKKILGASTIGFYVEGCGTTVWRTGTIFRWKI